MQEMLRCVRAGACERVCMGVCVCTCGCLLLEWPALCSDTWGLGEVASPTPLQCKSMSLTDSWVARG